MNKNLNFKLNKNGITLVALVISIVVLLILAGTSITAILGENGLLGRAANAKYEKDRQEAEFDVASALAGAYYDKFSADYGKDITKVYGIANLSKYISGRIDSTAVRRVIKDKIIWYTSPNNNKYTMYVNSEDKITTLDGYVLPINFFEDSNGTSNEIIWSVSDNSEINLFDAFILDDGFNNIGTSLGNGKYKLNFDASTLNDNNNVISGTVNGVRVNIRLYTDTQIRNEIVNMANEINTNEEMEFPETTEVQYLVDKVKIGEYVDFNIEYSSDYGNGGSVSSSDLTGWRVIGKKDNCVLITTAAIGLRYNEIFGTDTSVGAGIFGTVSGHFSNLRNVSEDINGNSLVFNQGLPISQAFEENDKYIAKDSTIPIMSLDNVVDIYKEIFSYLAEDKQPILNCTTSGVTLSLNGINYTQSMRNVFFTDSWIESRIEEHFGDDSRELDSRFKKLIYTGQAYFFLDAFSNEQGNYQWWMCDFAGQIKQGSNADIGIRPVITLGSDVCYQPEAGRDGSSAEKAYKIATESDLK